MTTKTKKKLLTPQAAVKKLNRMAGKVVYETAKVGWNSTSFYFMPTHTRISIAQLDFGPDAPKVRFGIFGDRYSEASSLEAVHASMLRRQMKVEAAKAEKADMLVRVRNISKVLKPIAKQLGGRLSERMTKFPEIEFKNGMTVAFYVNLEERRVEVRGAELPEKLEHFNKPLSPAALAFLGYIASIPKF